MSRKLTIPKNLSPLRMQVYYNEATYAKFWSPFSMITQYHLPEVRENPWWLDNDYIELPNIDNRGFRRGELIVVEG